MGSRDRHFFREGNWLYREIAKVLALRKEHPALRRGRQYLRGISGNGVDFGIPRMIGGEIRSVVPRSRLFEDVEVLLAVNMDPSAPRTAWVVVDRDLRDPGAELRCLYSTDAAQLAKTEAVEELADGKRVVRLTVPPAGFVAYL